MLHPSPSQQCFYRHDSPLFLASTVHTLPAQHQVTTHTSHCIHSPSSTPRPHPSTVLPPSAGRRQLLCEGVAAGGAAWRAETTSPGYDPPVYWSPGGVWQLFPPCLTSSVSSAFLLFFLFVICFTSLCFDWYCYHHVLYLHVSALIPVTYLIFFVCSYRSFVSNNACHFFLVCPLPFLNPSTIFLFIFSSCYSYVASLSSCVSFAFFNFMFLVLFISLIYCSFYY